MKALRYGAGSAVLAMFAAVANAEPPCSAADASLNCRLIGLLHWLEAAAVVLGVVSVVVIGVAIHLFRKNRGTRKAGR